jgi:hypothetical protein
VLALISRARDDAGIGKGAIGLCLVPTFPACEIADALDFLQHEGYVYSTIDDEHYRSTDDDVGCYQSTNPIVVGGDRCDLQRRQPSQSTTAVGGWAQDVVVAVLCMGNRLEVEACNTGWLATEIPFASHCVCAMAMVALDQRATTGQCAAALLAAGCLFVRWGI